MYSGRWRSEALSRSNMSTSPARLPPPSEPPLARVLDADDLLLRGDEERERVQRRGLARRRAAADDGAAAVLHGEPEVRHHLGAHGLEDEEVRGGERVAAEAPDGERAAARRH